MITTARNLFMTGLYGTTGRSAQSLKNFVAA
jgi:hypothetical protein